MKIDLYCAAVCRNNGLPTQLAGCGIVAMATAETEAKQREFGFALGNSTQHFAEIQAVTLGLMVIKWKFRQATIRLTIHSPYVLKMLAKSGQDWVSTPKINAENIDKMRRLISNYSVEIINLSKQTELPQFFHKAKQLASVASESQHHYDSETICLKL